MSTTSDRSWNTRRLARIAMAPLAALALAACVQSEAPILTDAQPLFGPQMRFQYYKLSADAAYDPALLSYRWDGKRYVDVQDETKESSAFTAFAYDGRTYILQTAPTTKDSSVKYLLARKMAGGVYLISLIDEGYADAETRAKFCKEIQTRPIQTCKIVTREGLFAFARATAAKTIDIGGLAIILADDK